MAKKKGRYFDWEKLAFAIADHIGKLQSYTAKVPVSILKRTGAITWPWNFGDWYGQKGQKFP